MTMQPKPRRAGLLADPRAGPGTQFTLDRRVIEAQRDLPQQLTPAHRGQTHRRLMHVKPDRDRPRIPHGRRPPYVARPRPTRQPTQMRRPPAILTERPDYPAAPSCLARPTASERVSPPPVGTF